MRLLVTGASGYVGGNLARKLAARGHKIIAPARNPSAVPAHANLQSIACDLALGLQSVPDDYDVVLHIAAHAPPRRDSTEEHLAHNLVATQNLVQHAARHPGRIFLFLSSISVYGDISAPVVDEKTPIVNPCSYGLSKRLGELLLQERSDRLRSCVLRLPGLIGPAAPANGVWLARMRESIRTGTPVNIHSPEKPFNNLVHLDDLADFVERLAAHTALPDFELLTLGSSSPIAVSEVVETLVRALSTKAKWTAQPAPRPPFTISYQRATERYGYQPTTVVDALKQFARE